MREVDFQSIANHPHVAELLDDHRVELPGPPDFLKSCTSFIDQEGFLHLPTYQVRGRTRTIVLCSTGGVVTSTCCVSDPHL